jgi:hypothetical protein
MVFSAVFKLRQSITFEDRFWALPGLLDAQVIRFHKKTG